MSTLTSSLVTAAAVGLASYCVYFDYKRRTDIKFRNELKDEERRVSQLRTESEPLSTKEKILESAKRVLGTVEGMTFPAEAQQKEQFFMEFLAKGEQLCTSSNVEDLEQASVCFYAGLKVYPVPQELIQLYQKSIPERVFQLLVHVIALDTPSETVNKSQIEELTSDEPFVEEIL